jgi:hypothetical protein
MKGLFLARMQGVALIGLIVVSAAKWGVADGQRKDASNAAIASERSSGGGWIGTLLQIGFRISLKKASVPHEWEFFDQVLERIPVKEHERNDVYSNIATWLAGDLAQPGGGSPKIVTSLLVFSGPYSKDEKLGLIDEQWEQPPGYGHHLFLGSFRRRAQAAQTTATIAATIAIPEEHSKEEFLVTVTKRYRYVGGKWHFIESSSRVLE